MSQQHPLPPTLLHGRTHYNLSVDPIAGGDMYSVKGKERKYGVSEPSLGAGADDESLLYAWKVKWDPKSGKCFFVNCAGLGKKWRLPDYYDFGFQQEIELFLLNKRQQQRERDLEEQRKRFAPASQYTAATTTMGGAATAVSSTHSTRAALNIPALEKPWQPMQPFSDPTPLASPPMAPFTTITVQSSKNGTPTPMDGGYYTKSSGTVTDSRPSVSATPLGAADGVSEVVIQPAAVVTTSSHTRKERATPTVDSLETSTTLQALRHQLRSDSQKLTSPSGLQSPIEGIQESDGLVHSRSEPTLVQHNHSPQNTNQDQGYMIGLYQQLQLQNQQQQAQQKQQQAALDALTAVVQSLQAMLESERSSKSQLQQQLAERDRILLERKVADAEAEEDDLKLKMRMLEALAARRREDERLREAAEDERYRRDAVLRQKMLPTINGNVDSRAVSTASASQPPLPARSLSAYRSVSEQSSYLY